MRRDFALEQRRMAEFNAAETGADVLNLLRRWGHEDTAAEAAASAQARAIDELQRRVAALEKLLGPSGKGLIGPVIGGIADALRQFRTEEREHTLKTIRDELQRKDITIA